MIRFIVVKDGNGWRVQDAETGRLHSARIVRGGRARAQRQADAMNERIARIAADDPFTGIGGQPL